MINLLQAGKGYNVEGLAQDCGVSRRTIFRDLETLRQSGMPLIFDERQQRYRAAGAQYLPPTNFTSEEALAVIVLCHEMGDRLRLPFFGPARSAAVKLSSVLPGRLREQLGNVADAVQIKLPPSNPLAGKRPIYELLLEAVSARRCVRIRYDSLAEKDSIQTRISPYRVFFSRRSWYVVGRSSIHRAVRTFNVGRIDGAEILEDTYQIPRGFSINRYLRNAWHLIPEPGHDQKIIIRFSQMVARNVAEVTWHKTQQLSFNDDGTLDFSVTVSGLKEISWWILGYGDQAEVLQPEELRRLVAQRCKRAAQQYQKKKKGPGPYLAR